MKSPSFVECISALSNELYRHKKKESFKYGNDFWYIINNLNEKELVNWCERLIKVKGIVQGKTYAMLADILHDYKTDKEFWSVKQKRWLAMTLVTHRDDISLYYEY